MKKIFFSGIAVTLLLLLFSTVLPRSLGDFCGRDKNMTFILASEEKEYIVKNGTSNYSLLFSADAFSADQVCASELSQKILSNFGVIIRAQSDATATQSEHEILVGNTTRQLSKDLTSALVNATVADELRWGVAFKDGKLAFAANCNEALAYGKGDFLALVGSNEFAVSSSLWLTYSATRAEYDAYVKEQERLQHLKEIEELKGKIAAFDDTLFGERTPMPSGYYSKPEYYPTQGQHPRLMLTENTLPDIKKILENPQYTELSSQFWIYANTKTDGKLPPLTGKKTYNFSEDTLMTIEAKALAYLITADEKYGYEAIYAAKNFMLTLVLSHEIATDIYRTYGLCMVVTGEVYDWCYDLLTETDKSQFVRGVQKYYCEDCPCGKSDKAEIGYPPTALYATQGHGTSTGILRDYLSFAVAVFDEYPDWWELVAGRFYQEFVPAGNVFLSVGANTQGINVYGAGSKVISQCYAAWIVKTATGEMPYTDGLANVGKYYMHARLPSGRTFQSGDGVNTEDGAMETVDDFIFILAGLYPSEINQINVKVLLDNYTSYSYFNGTASMSPTTMLIYRSAGLEYEPESTDINEGLELVHYVADPMGEMFARNSWTQDAAAVFMRVRGLSGGNHDHDDAGTFQIYYKGCLTSESGQYGTGAGYGTSHNLYWSHATISHNGLLVYNPALADTNGGWYSGSQIRRSGVETLDELLYTDKMRMATVTGYDYFYTPDTGALEHAYLAGNITASYSADTVDFIERRMLTVYTGMEDFPMFFVVYDYIKSKDASFKKSFIMHTCTEPEVNENVATYVQNDGKMVLTTLTDGAVMSKIGGEGKTYWINDTVGNLNVAEAGDHTAADKGDSDYLSDGKLWGRIQVDNVGKVEDYLLNVIYVTDATNNKTLSPTKLESDTLIGMQMSGVLTLYLKSTEKVRTGIELQTEGKGLQRYYISGLAAGTWRVKVDGVSVAHVYTGEESGLIDFVAPLGELSIEPGVDVRPANSDNIVYDAGGVPMPDDAMYFYEHDVEYVLPVLNNTDNQVFAGWYASADSTERIYTIEPGTRGTVKLIARFYTTVTEDYEKTAFMISEMSKKFGGIEYAAKNKADSSFSTKKDVSTGNSYLLWKAGASDPQIILNSVTPSVVLVDKTVLTYQIDLALVEGEEPMTSMFRLRGENNNHNVAIFKTNEEGKVLLGANEAAVVTTLTTEMQTISISIDFANMVLYAFDSDGFVICSTPMKLSAADAHLTGLEYMQSCTCLFNWYSYGNAAFKIDNIKIVYDYLENSNVPDASLPNAIIYNNLNGGVLPKDASYVYSYDKPTALPTEITVPEGMIFDGWYSDASYTKKVTEVPLGYTGRFNAYAKYRYYVTEDFEKVTIDISNPDGATDSKLYNKTVDGISYNSNQKPGTAYKTVSDGKGNTYLLWTSGIGDPTMSKSGSLYDLLKGDTAVTYSFQIASDGDSAVPKTAFRIRESSSAQFALFTTDPDGGIYLNANKGLKIGSITDEFLYVIISIDFANGTLTTYNPDGTIAKNPDTDTPLVASITLPGASSATDLVDFISHTTSYFAWYTFGDDSFDSRALRIDDLTVTSGKYVGYASSEGEPNIIIYEGLNGATMPADAPTVYSSEEKTQLVSPIDIPDGMVFLGWYKDAAFTTPISAIPIGTSGTFKAYAKFLVSFKMDFETVVIDHSNPDGASDSSLYNKTVGGVSYNANQKPGAGYKTVTDESGNTYLLWTSGIGDPQIVKGSLLKDLLAGETAVTYTLKIAKDGDSAVPKTAFRIRESGSAQFAAFTTDADDGIYLNANKGLKIGNITDEFLQVIITVDFAQGTLTAYNPDGTVAKNPDSGIDLKADIYLPSASKATDLVDFINYINCYFTWYTFGDDSFDSRALRIDDICVIPGSYKV